MITISNYQVSLFLVCIVNYAIGMASDNPGHITIEEDDTDEYNDL